MFEKVATVQQLREALAAASSNGGAIKMTEEVYDLGTQSLDWKQQVTLEGCGHQTHEAFAVNAPTTLLYSGTGAAINVGSPTMTDFLHGAVFRRFGIRGDGAGTAGVHFHWNGAQDDTIRFPARCLVEEVSVRGFNGGGDGFRCDFGVKIDFVRSYAFLNSCGYRINGGTTYGCDSIMARSNEIGMKAHGFQGLGIRGNSIFEANVGAGILVNLAGVDARNFYLEGAHFEHNNTTPDSIPWQCAVYQGVGGILRNASFRDLEFSGANGAGDILLDGVFFGSVFNVNSFAAASKVTLQVQATCGSITRHLVNGPNIDPDGRARII